MGIFRIYLRFLLSFCSWSAQFYYKQFYLQAKAEWVRDMKHRCHCPRNCRRQRAPSPATSRVRPHRPYWWATRALFELDARSVDLPFGNHPAGFSASRSRTYLEWVSRCHWVVIHDGCSSLSLQLRRTPGCRPWRIQGPFLQTRGQERASWVVC